MSGIALDIGVAALPDSRIIRDAVARAREGAPPFLFHHAMRSAFFAELYRKSHAQGADPELVALAALLHDIGLHLDCSGDERFELRSANRARAFLECYGVEPAKSWLVWDTIALHTHDLNLHKEPEARAAQMGILTDVIGAEAALLGPDALAAVVDQFPRLGFKQCFLSLLTEEARRDVELPPFHPSVMIRHTETGATAIPDAGELLRQAPFNE